MCLMNQNLGQRKAHLDLNWSQSWLKRKAKPEPTLFSTNLCQMPPQDAAENISFLLQLIEVWNEKKRRRIEEFQTATVMHSAVIHTEIFEKKNWSSKLSESHHGVMVWCSGTIGSILMSFWALYRPLTQYLQNHGLQKWDFSKIQFLTLNHCKMHYN